MNHKTLSLKRGRKNLIRKRVREHIRRVGRENYEAEQIFVFCAVCKELRNVRQMTLKSSGLGLGPCKKCVQKEKSDGGDTRVK